MLLPLFFPGVAFDKNEGHPRIFTASPSKAILSPRRLHHENKNHFRGIACATRPLNADAESEYIGRLVSGSGTSGASSIATKSVIYSGRLRPPLRF